MSTKPFPCPREPPCTPRHLACLPTAGAAVPDGDEGGEDAGHHRGVLHLLLVPLLHHVPGHGLLRGLRAAPPILGHLLAGILQLGHQPLHLRGVLSRFPVGRMLGSWFGAILLPSK